MIEIRIENRATGESSEFLAGGLRGFLKAAEAWLGSNCRDCVLSARLINDSEELSEKKGESELETSDTVAGTATARPNRAGGVDLTANKEG